VQQRREQIDTGADAGVAAALFESCRGSVEAVGCRVQLAQAAQGMGAAGEQLGAQVRERLGAVGREPLDAREGGEGQGGELGGLGGVECSGLFSTYSLLFVNITIARRRSDGPGSRI
jgi:hypothetical protein